MVNMEVSLGGYVAEEMFTGTTSSGPCSDLNNVARNARLMIREFGMGSFKFNVDTAYNSHDYFEASEETSREIELQIKGLVDECLENVRKILTGHKDKLKRLAEALVEKETLSYKEIAQILEPQKSEIDIERELLVLAEKRLVGKVPVINLEAIKGLAALGQGNGKKNGSGEKSEEADKKSPESKKEADSTDKETT